MISHLNVCWKRMPGETPGTRMVKLYLRDHRGTPIQEGHVAVQQLTLGYEWSGKVTIEKIEDLEPLLSEVQSRTGIAYWNPKPGQIGEWSEVFDFFWIKDGLDADAQIIMPAHKETRKENLVRARYHLDRDSLIWPEVGHIYRAAKPKVISKIFRDIVNDISILQVPQHIFGPDTSIQYEPAGLRIGKRYPKMTLIKFWAWVGEDVTEAYKEVEEGEWMTWEAYREGQKAKKV